MEQEFFLIDPQVFIDARELCFEQEGNRTVLHGDQSLITAFSNGLPPEDEPIWNILASMQEAISSAVNQLRLPPITANAFNNVRGSWFEFMVTVAIWNERAENKDYHSKVLVRLPNVSRLKFIDLFEPTAKSMLSQLELVLRPAGVNLVTSNPDIICAGNLEGNNVEAESLFLTTFTTYSSTCRETVLNAYRSIVGRCRYNSIYFGIGLKSSTRPDRRLQIPHEGSILKAINAHLQTRFWDANHQVYYHAATAFEPGPADLEAFKTAATHSITNVNVDPMPAVDKVFYLKTLGEVKNMLRDCMADTDS